MPFVFLCALMPLWKRKMDPLRRLARRVAALAQQRQGDCESRAATFALAFGTHRAAMHLDNMTDDGQSQAQPAVRSCAGRIGLPKVLERKWQELAAHALSAITDNDPRAVVVAFESNLDAPARWCELDGVRQQIPHHLL